MKKTLTWLGVAVGSLAVFAGAGFGVTLVNKDSLATHMIEKYTGTNKDSSSNSSTTSSSVEDSVALKVTKSSNLDSILNNGEYNGSAALNTGKKILTSSRGYANHSAKNTMTAESQFLVGKVQDTINNGIIMHLIDTGKVKLSDKLSKYDSSVAGAESVTVKDVMNQTSGITAMDVASKGKAKSLVKEVNANATYDSTTQGTFADSRVNTILQAAIIEKATGESYRSVVQDLIDQLELSNTAFGMKEKTVDYYQVDDLGSASKVESSELDTAEINRMGSDQMVSSPSDIAQLYSYLFNSDYVSSSTLEKVFDQSSDHSAGFAVNGDSISLTQAIVGGRNRIEWNLKKQTGTFLFSNYINGENNLSSISQNMFDYLN
jgi:CubicO group peptidase (beta-lactamase class C family)